MKSSHVTKKILTLITAVMLATVMIIGPALTASAAAKSPHRDPEKPITGPMWIVYNDNKISYLYPDSYALSRYVEQMGRDLPARLPEIQQRMAAGQSTVTCYTGDKPRSDGIKDVLVYTDYTEYDTIINSVSRGEMLAAIKEINTVDGHIDKILPEVGTRAVERGFARESCSVGALFDMTYYLVNPDHIYSNDFKSVHVCMSRFNLEDNFICLLHRNNGAWEIVENATLSGNTLTFEVNDLSPFALVVGEYGSIFEEGAKQAPKTGDQTFAWTAAAIGSLMLLLGAGYILLRKKNHVR